MGEPGEMIIVSRTTRDRLTCGGVLNIIENQSKIRTVRSAFGDREYSTILLTTGSPTVVGKPAAIESWIRHGGSVRYVGSNLKTTKTGIGKNYEQSIFTKLYRMKIRLGGSNLA